ncbi:receptor-type tyrosine-protein phosphatase eta-like [Rana temporaria]|uniref:receptor-type tyrosine-protein phosphatase eta-like n=1 Tax=Rana temporaria TaxID=8407 RepID=UPI001AAD19CF|nr:receptor-type tyrosine-protein phosphatase eta-like [Rana temporaria]
MAAKGRVDSYIITITGVASKTTQTNSTQTNFTGLLPGSLYIVTVQTNSGNCSQTSSPVMEATYPTPPGIITFPMIGTKNATLSWGDPVNMTGVVKSYNITYWNSSSPSIMSGTVRSNTTNVTLQNLISGTNYTISVVTVGALGYKSTAVIGLVCTKPLSVKSPQIVAKTTNSMSLTWTQPDEYQSSYSYRVQTIVISSSTLINNTIVSGASATIGYLTAGETYTFTVYTISTCNSTESDPTSITDCTLPGQVVGAAANSYTSVNSLFVNWTAPQGKMSNYTVTITEDINSTIQTLTIQPNTMPVNVTGLLPGRVYNVTIVTVSSSCSQAAPSLSQATYPTPPGSITFPMIGTENVTLSWGDPVNMTGVVKSYNIIYRNSSSPSIIAGNVTSDTTSVTLQNIISGTNYTISVVTVGVWGYQTTAVIGSVCTKPLSVKSPQIGAKTTNSMSLTWTQPDEYQSSYTYRVQTNVTSSSEMINNIIVSGASATIGNLTAGETYTFLIYTISACNIQSDPTSITDCTLPGQVVGAAANSYMSVNSLFVNWTAPQGKVSNYTVTITEDINNTIQTLTIQPNTMPVNVTGLLPGRVYNVTIVTVSSSCSQVAPSLSQATYPTPPGSITFTMVGTKNVTLSWGEPVNMGGVVKSYNITYWNSSSPSIIAGNVTSDTTSVTLQNLISGTNYTISVVTVGVWGYQSTSVIGSVCTIPGQALAITVNNYESVDSLVVNWTAPAGKVSKYVVSIIGDVNGTQETNSLSVTFLKLLPGRSYMITIQTFSGDSANTAPPVTEATYPTPPQSLNFNSVGSDSITISWEDPANMTGLALSYNIIWNSTSISGTVISNAPTVTLQSLAPATNYTITVITVGARGYQSTPVTGWIFTSPLEQPGGIKVVRSTSGDAMDVTFQGFDTSNGPIVAYAIIVTTDLNANKSPEGVLAKTYNDFKNGTTKTYVTSIIEQKSQRVSRSSEIGAHVGDGSESHGYVNGPLDSTLQYRVSVAGFTRVNYDPTIGTINEDQSTATITSFSGSPSVTTTTATTTTKATSASTKPSYTNATVTTSNTGTHHGQHICCLPLSYFQLMIFVLYSFIYR